MQRQNDLYAELTGAVAAVCAAFSSLSPSKQNALGNILELLGQALQTASAMSDAEDTTSAREIEGIKRRLDALERNVRRE